MLHHADFVPRVRDPGGWLKNAQFDTFEEAVAAAGRWIEDTAVELVQIETVVLPNIHRPEEEGTGDASIHTSADFMSFWHQFVRVWYRA